jgi:hypothetical protein
MPLLFFASLNYFCCSEAVGDLYDLYLVLFAFLCVGYEDYKALYPSYAVSSPTDFGYFYIVFFPYFYWLVSKEGASIPKISCTRIRSAPLP